jgi:hypothetical protein
MILRHAVEQKQTIGKRHAESMTEPLVTEIMAPDRPHNALIYLAATSTDLYSEEYNNAPFGSGINEAWYGQAGVWSLFYLGDASKSESAYRGCLRRSCAVAAEAARRNRR